MTKDDILNIYKERYEYLPDLLERLISQLDITFFCAEYGKPKTPIAFFNDWSNTKEKRNFWNQVYWNDELGTLTREKLDSINASHFTQPSVEVEKEWEPEHEEEAEFSDDQVHWQVASFIYKHKGEYVAYVEHSDSYQGYAFARKIPPLEITREEATALLSQYQGKQVVIKD